MTASNALTSTTVKTMSSIELVALINDVRKEKGKKALLHANFMAKIERHPGVTSAKFLGHVDVPGPNGAMRRSKCYNLPKRECELMVMSESLEVQTKVYDRLAEVEAKAEMPTLNNPIMNMIVQQAIQYDKLEQQQKELAQSLQTNTLMLAHTTARVEQVAALVGAQNPQNYSIKAYANVVGIRVTDLVALKLGRAASSMSRKLGVDIGSVKDAVYGKVNAYHESVLIEVFDAEVLV